MDVCCIASLYFLANIDAALRRFCYPGLTVCYLPKRPCQASKAHSVLPICCVFLERQAAAVPVLSPIARLDLSRRLGESILFRDSDSSAQPSALTFQALEQLPAYHLAYGSDPAAAAVLIHKMLAQD